MKEKEISILHLASDEKFINGANYIFEKAFPGSNHFIIPKSRFNRKLKFVKPMENFEFVTFSNGIGLAKKLAARTQAYDCVVLHALNDFNCTVFLLSESKSKFIGIIWGAELYTNDNFPDSVLLGKQTAQLHFPEPKKSIQSLIKDLIRKYTYTKDSIIPDATNKAAGEIEYIGGMSDILFDDFKKKNLLSANSKLIPYTYYPLEFIMKGNESAVVRGNDILLGNSASKTNNHLEAFQLLEKFELKDRKLIIPLSYGDSQYADHIIETGERLLSNIVIPLRNFMQLAEYNSLMQRCGIVLMNHYRQQAIGNIIAMLWLGSKVYLSERNPVLRYFKKMGVLVFSVEKELVVKNSKALERLTEEEIESNRKILKERFSESSVAASLRGQIMKYFY